MQKYKIIKGTSVPSDKEINQHKNFESLLKAHQSAFLKKLYLKIGAGLAAIGVLVAFFLLAGLPAEDTTKKPDQSLPDTLGQLKKDKSHFNDHGLPAGAPEKDIPAAINVLPSKIYPKKNNVSIVKRKNGAQTQAKENKINNRLNTKEITSISESTIKKRNEKLFNKLKIDPTTTLPVFSEAVPLDGYSALHRYLGKNLLYPAQAMEEKVSGVVVVGFFIDENGQAQNLKIIESLGQECDQEAIRLIKSMPRWRPALAYGKPVKTEISLPIRFHIP